MRNLLWATLNLRTAARGHNHTTLTVDKHRNQGTSVLPNGRWLRNGFWNATYAMFEFTTLVMRICDCFALFRQKVITSSQIVTPLRVCLPWICVVQQSHVDAGTAHARCGLTSRQRHHSRDTITTAHRRRPARQHGARRAVEDAADREQSSAV